MLSAPEKPGLAMPDEPKLAAVIARAAAGSADLKPWVDAVANATLMDSAPAPGKIANAAERAEFGVTEWTLSNGVKVVLKPTTNKADEVVFRAFSPGGTSLAPDADYIPASTRRRWSSRLAAWGSSARSNSGTSSRAGWPPRRRASANSRKACPAPRRRRTSRRSSS